MFDLGLDRSTISYLLYGRLLALPANIRIDHSINENFLFCY